MIRYIAVPSLLLVGLHLSISSARDKADLAATIGPQVGMPKSSRRAGASVIEHQLLRNVAIAVASQTATGTGDNKTARLDEYLSGVASKLGFSGSVLVARKNKVLLDRGYGWANRQKTSRVKRSTRFYIASISKQFTAAGILKLEEQGRLSLDDPIIKYLGDVRKDEAGITIQELLTHTSGIGQTYAADGIRDRTAAIRAILGKPLEGVPGGGFIYSDVGYSLLAAIIEIVSGETYETFIREQVLAPAGLSHTGFWGDAATKGGQIAQTLQELDADIKLPNWGFRGGTGMFSTTGDLYRWKRALFEDKVLKKKSREMMLAPYVNTTRGSYGYGWFTSKTKEGRQKIWTAGLEDFGHNAILETFDDGTVIIVSSNAGNLSGVPARDVVSSALEGIMFATPARPNKAP